MVIVCPVSAGHIMNKETNKNQALTIFIIIASCSRIFGIITCLSLCCYDAILIDLKDGLSPHKLCKRVLEWVDGVRLVGK